MFLWPSSYNSSSTSLRAPLSPWQLYPPPSHPCTSTNLVFLKAHTTATRFSLWVQGRAVGQSGDFVCPLNIHPHEEIFEDWQWDLFPICLRREAFLHYRPVSHCHLELFINTACGPTMFQSTQLKKALYVQWSLWKKKLRKGRVIIGFHSVMVKTLNPRWMALDGRVEEKQSDCTVAAAADFSAFALNRSRRHTCNTISFFS